MASVSGDESGFEELFRHHYEAVLSHCAGRTSPADAADATAETFLIAWRRVDDLAGVDNVLAWLLAVANNTLANHYRSKARRQRLRERAAAHAWVPRVAGSGMSEATEEVDVVAALDHLNDTDREILALAIWEDMSPVEIASTLGISRPAVDQRFLRAKRHLARELGV